MINLEPIPYQIQKRLFEKMKVLGTQEWIKEQFGRLHAFRGGNKR